MPVKTDERKRRIYFGMFHSRRSSNLLKLARLYPWAKAAGFYAPLDKSASLILNQIAIAVIFQ